MTMKKIFALSVLMLLAVAQVPSYAQVKVKKTLGIPKKSKGMTAKTIYEFKVEDIEGKDFSLASLRGKKVMIVNTASKCGLTPQYKELEALYQKYKDRNFVVIGFPANNFAEQEPGDNAAIQKFCERNYGVTFPMMSKISVAGKDKHPLYEFLTLSVNKEKPEEVSWNFQKFLINPDGTVHSSISPKESPQSEEVVKWIEGR